MGHAITTYVKRNARTGAKIIKGPKDTYRALALHPNFEWPKLPANREPEAVAKFCLEAIARFVSPPKIEGENEEFACEDISTAIRTLFKAKLLEKIAEPMK